MADSMTTEQTTKSSNDGSTVLFYEFCGNVTFWDDARVYQESPEFSACFEQTVLVWLPCSWLWLAAPLYLYYMHQSRRKVPLPLTPLTLARAGLSFVLMCLVALQLIFQEHAGFSCDPGTSPSPATYSAAGVKFVTFMLSIFIQHVQRRKGLVTSAVPFVFWVMLVFSEIVPLYTHATRQNYCGEDYVYFIYIGVIVVQLMAHCIADKASHTGYTDMDLQNACPDEGASILSRITYNWLTLLVWRCYWKTFSADSHWNQTSRMRSDLLVPELEKEWNEETRQAQIARNIARNRAWRRVYDGDKAGSHIGHTETTPLLESGVHTDTHTDHKDGIRPSLYLALLRCFWKVWLEATSYQGVGQIVWLIQPIILRSVISIVEGADAPVWQGYTYAVLLLVTMCVDSFMFHVGFHHMLSVGLRAKTALIGIIYNKALTMNKGCLSAGTVGEVVNLMSVDCQRIQDGVMFSYYIVLIIPIIGIALAQLWSIMGVASLGGLAVILVILPVMGYIATRQYALQQRLLQLKGSRIKILNEVVGGIKVLKMYAWEPSFMRKIRDIREKEIACLRKYAYYTATSVVLAVHSPFVIMLVLILIYVLTSETYTLGAEEAFTALSMVNILRYPIALCPFLVNGAVQGMVSVGRIQKFLWTEDLNTENVNFVTEAEHPVNIDGATFTWNIEQDTPTLRNISVQVGAGELVAVVGPVGSGKSSLVSACLGEMERLTGTASVRGKIAYVPQEAWIQNMTLRDNILFGKPYNERKYRKVIDACALAPDLKILAGGDMIEIGEKGINISGGQKQRVSLARAVYNNAEVYFLDDPLSAVDSHVGKHLFKRVIGNEGLLKHKTRILVTHGIHWLPLVDRILVMSDGAVVESGTYEQLISRPSAFSALVHTYLGQTDGTGSAAGNQDEDPEVTSLREAIRSRVSDAGISSDDELLTSGSRRRSRLTSTTSDSGRLRVPSGAEKKAPGLTFEDLSRLTLDEETQEGAIKPAVLYRYMKAMGFLSVVVVFVSLSVFQGLNVFSNFWLTYWTEDPELRITSPQSPDSYHRNSSTPIIDQRWNSSQLYVDLDVRNSSPSQTHLISNSSDPSPDDRRELTNFYLLMYLLFGVVQGIFLLAAFMTALTRMVTASGKLHDSMLTSILRAPMAFFDTTPIGRIMNRFSSDVDIMDNKLPESFRLWSIMLFSTIAVVVVVAVITPVFIAAIVPIAIIYAFCVTFYLPTARQMRRTESVKRSPIYNHFSETITGSAVIRAYRCSDRFIRESRRRVDDNSRFYYASNTGARWIGIRLELLGNVIALLATIFGLASDSLNGAQVGLSITYAVQITITLNLVVFAISEMEMNIVSAERVNEYTSLPSEAGWVIDQGRPPVDWPRTGKIEFRNYLTRYRDGLDLVLRGITCTIQTGEKVGIVGRTGAGKSSLTLCLFRLIESAGGGIFIDGVNIASLGLHDLRSKLTILPQDPVLFSGTLRSNLDPFRKYNDESIWYAIECAHLKTFVSGLAEGLEYECGECGFNLSVGQRQLVCLARTLLHKTRVLILDEATAAVDMATDDLIQDVIRSQFGDCTILTVAHRLNTVLDYDRVMVLDAGLIKEFDSPSKLLADPDSVFHGMARDAGLV